MEKQYKEGAIKHAIVAVLKAVQPEALTTQGVFWLWRTNRCCCAAVPSALSAPPEEFLLSIDSCQPCSPPAGIVDKAKELSIEGLEEKQKTILQASPTAKLQAASQPGAQG